MTGVCVYVSIRLTLRVCVCVCVSADVRARERAHGVDVHPYRALRNGLDGVQGRPCRRSPRPPQRRDHGCVLIRLVGDTLVFE